MGIIDSFVAAFNLGCRHRKHLPGERAYQVLLAEWDRRWSAAHDSRIPQITDVKRLESLLWIVSGWSLCKFIFHIQEDRTASHGPESFLAAKFKVPGTREHQTSAWG